MISPASGDLIGALPVEGGVAFRLWAPGRRSVEVLVMGDDEESPYPLQMEGAGYFSAVVPGLTAGARYRYRLDEEETVPDPASRSQPEGVHGPSEVVGPDAFPWSDQRWRGLSMEEMVVYELHIGAATPEGTFQALIPRLDALRELGVTALELMPVGEFPGERNWGYDGVAIYAPESSYGGADGLRRLVDACHARGLGVILDVVYNHFGPEGNYLPTVTGGRIFTERHHTPWGAAINYDGPESGPVRDFVIGNAIHWAREYHVDGLRLDATHAILDDSPIHLLRELTERVRASLPEDRHFVVIAEDERNERRLVLPPREGGMGLDAVWADDFHHQLRRLTAGDDEGYFAAFSGSAEDLATTLRRGWYFDGSVHVPGADQEVERRQTETGTSRGTPASGLPPRAFVHCIQNHDQVGNRAMGDRLNHAVSLPTYRAASALLLLSPYTPLLWMGQEWAASTPFQYFTDHPEELGRLVTKGRRAEFGNFSAFSDPQSRGRIPDPQAEETFRRSKLEWEERERMPHAGIRSLYTELLRLRRKELAGLAQGGGFAVVALGVGALAMRRETLEGGAILLIVSFTGGTDVDLGASRELGPPGGAQWKLLLSTEEGRFGGEGEGELVVLDRSRLELRGAGGAVLRATSPLP